MLDEWSQSIQILLKKKEHSSGGKGDRVSMNEPHITFSGPEMV